METNVTTLGVGWEASGSQKSIKASLMMQRALQDMEKTTFSLLKFLSYNNNKLN